VKNKAELVVTLNGEAILRKKLTHVQPSEMISVSLEAGRIGVGAVQRENRIQVGLE